MSRKFRLKQISIGTWEIIGYPLRVVRTQSGDKWKAQVVNTSTNIILASKIESFPKKAIYRAVACALES